jgi:exportin-5
MLSDYHFNDPSITQRQVKTAVEISAKAFQKDTGFAVSVLEHILASFVPTKPEHLAYSEGVTELYSYNTAELRRLAQYHADYFATFYDQLSTKFGDLIGSLHVEPRIQTDLKSILFLILQRASTTDPEQQRARLWTFLEPLSNAWSNAELQQSLSSFGSYTHDQGFDNVAPFLGSINAGQIEDWTSTSTSEDGHRIQQQMSEAYNNLPLRETRVLLSTSTDRLEQDSPMHRTMCELWTPMVPEILRAVLQIASYNHQLHDPSGWPNTTPDLMPILKRVLRDRYWQSGISEGTMNDFHSKVKQTKSTLEGFASSVRGRIRTSLEQCYSIVHTLGRLGERFYSMSQVPEMIAEAMVSSTGPLSPHHFSVLLLMLPKLIEECPPSFRQHFLTPILSALLREMDSKLVREWDTLAARKQAAQDTDNLGDEMRDESVLRQTTYKAVNMVSLWLSPRREFELSSKKAIVNGQHLANGDKSQSMADFVLSNQQVLEPLLVFTTHALTFKDTKATQTMILTAQRIIPAFINENYLHGDAAASVREFISSETLKAAITALHDSHFADYQQYFAQLIAQIWLAYGLPAHVPASETSPAHDRPALTATPQNILLSLPSMTETKIHAAAEKLLKEGLNGKSKKLRAIVLHLLESVRGVRISELGKIDIRAQQSRILEKYKQRESLGMQGIEIKPEAEGPDLGGVADMFGGN